MFSHLLLTLLLAPPHVVGRSTIVSDKHELPHSNDDIVITTIKGDGNWSTCVVTPRLAIPGRNDKIEFHFDGRKLFTKDLTCPGLHHHSNVEDASFLTTTSSTGVVSRGTDPLHRMGLHRWETCQDAVYGLKRIYQRSTDYSYLNFNNALCLEYTNLKLKQWIYDGINSDYSGDNTPIGGCVLSEKRGNPSISIALHRDRDTRSLRTLFLPCSDGTDYRGRINGIIHARNNRKGKQWTLSQDPLVDLDIALRPLSASTCLEATVLMFTGLGVGVEKIGSPTFEVLTTIMCDLFHQKSAGVKKEDIISPDITPTNVDLFRRRRKGESISLDGVRKDESVERQYNGRKPEEPNVSTEVRKEESVERQYNGRKPEEPNVSTEAPEEESVERQYNGRKPEEPIFSTEAPEEESIGRRYNRRKQEKSIVSTGVSKSELVGRRYADLTKSPELTETTKLIRDRRTAMRKKGKHCSLC